MQLPGGNYWNPDKDVLCLSNDICKSLNDHQPSSNVTLKPCAS